MGIHRKLNRSLYIHTRVVLVKRYRLFYWKIFIVNGEIESGKDVDGMKIDTYKELIYEEDERKSNPIAFAHNGKGNRKCQHVIISDKKQVKAFLNRYDLTGITDENISISILWNLPRKQYDETNMWVCLSGFTYNEKEVYPKHFVISDNIVTEEAQNRAKEMIDMLNTWNGIEVFYNK